MKNLFNKFSVKQLSVSLFGVSATIEIKKNISAEISKQEGSVKQQVLIELYTLRNVLSDFYFNYIAIEEISLNNGLDEEEMSTEKAERLFMSAFDVFFNFSSELFKTKYFVLLGKHERATIIGVLDKVLYEKMMMKEDENYFMDEDEQLEIITEVCNLFNEITEQIEELSNYFN